MTDKPSPYEGPWPELLPLLPLSGVVLLPQGMLPLNIFEPRYLALIEDALGQGRLVGLVQPSAEGHPPPLYQVGCVGRIVSFAETEDGRFLINLLGLRRFRIEEEVAPCRDYRRARPAWSAFDTDLRAAEPPTYDRTRLMNALKVYFKIYGVAADWSAVETSANEGLISSLAMICPLPPNEKQALLEAPTLAARADLLITLLEMACLPQDEAAARH